MDHRNLNNHAEPDEWAREMVRDLPPLTREQILSVTVYRRAFPWLAETARIPQY